MVKKELSLGVFCGSRRGKRAQISDAAHEVARLLAKRQWNLVFGGGDSGIMGALAGQMLRHNRSVYGVSSRDLSRQETPMKGMTHHDICQNLEIRKRKMFDLADAFLIFPGGVGTLDEFFTLLAFRSLGQIEKPVAILNIEGYWYGLRALLDRMMREGFMQKKDDVRFLNDLDMCDSWFEEVQNFYKNT